jgi:hypothetical protein
MYASIDFATKKDFRLAVLQGLPIVLYSPVLGTAAINGKETVMGPWPLSKTPKAEPMIGPKERRDCRGARCWVAQVEVKDMRVVAVR